MTDNATRSEPQRSAGTSSVVSRDGTLIGYSRAGTGEPVVLVDGALNDRRLNGPNPRLAKALVSQFTVFTYDRRGRGESGNTQPYAVEREIEDLDAVIDAAGGSAYVYGISSGGALALEAATRLESIRKLALYELPFVTDGSRKPVPADAAEHFDDLIVRGRRAEALRYFFTELVALPAAMVALMRFMPAWSKLKALAPTLSYDARVIHGTGSGGPLPTDRWARATAPTLVLAGGKSPVWMQNSMRTLAQVLPNAAHRTLEGQTHLVKPHALAPVLNEFFSN
ncbi:MAG: alpha/beta hydrolase [Solirubrobacterales bacterium]|nr:alpha/beta hydrolase [Solirubrobacterales bacterium]